MTDDVPHPLEAPPNERQWVRVAAELAEKFAQRAAEHDASAKVPLQNLTELHGSGLDAALLPREAGGEGLGYRAFGEIVRLLSGACPSTACIWVMHIGASVGLVNLSRPEASRFYADQLIAGARFANALSEPSGGNRFLVPMQHAEPAADGGHVLTGAKRFASGATIADHFLVNALVDDVPTFFGVAKDDTIGFVGNWDAMGLRASDSQLLEFTRTPLCAERRCPPSVGDRPNHIAAGISSLSLGVAQALLREVMAYAAGRRIPPGETVLADQDWLQREVADVHTRLEAATMYARHMEWLADQCSPEFLAATVRAKLLTNAIAEDAARLALHAGGGHAYLRGTTIERLFRDAQAGHLMAYSAEVCQGILGTGLMTAAKDRHGD
ncbi:acyl-CoA dehydrogenase family protein [Amycolatopsis sp. lyj-112]|uniref:acyl-CoA dehydrogenase family protein n=1 Tax=Amycolatopsis sp. lyj-112 TaxID=2789288 RepID=UPI003979E8F8